MHCLFFTYLLNSITIFLIGFSYYLLFYSFLIKLPLKYFKLVLFLLSNLIIRLLKQSFILPIFLSVHSFNRLKHLVFSFPFLIILHFLRLLMLSFMLLLLLHLFPNYVLQSVLMFCLNSIIHHTSLGISFLFLSNFVFQYYVIHLVILFFIHFLLLVFKLN